MNAPSYQYNQQSAEQADAGLRITDTGAYVGRFVQAYHHQAASGACAVNLDFKALDGSSANLSIWTVAKSGEPIDSGVKRLNAIMALLGIKDGIRPTEGVIERWDFDAGQMGKVQAPVFATLVNQPIGVVLQKELYTKTQGQSAGQDGSRVQMVRVFDAQSGKTAKEKLQNTEAKAIDALLASLGDKDTRSTVQPAQAPAQASADDFGDVPW